MGSKKFVAQEQLKSLKALRERAEAELDAARQEEAFAVAKRIGFERKVEDLRARETAIASKKRDVIVSDHAIIRLLERGFGMDITKIREDLAAQLRPGVAFSSTGKFPVGDGLRAVVKDSVVVTIEPS